MLVLLGKIMYLLDNELKLSRVKCFSNTQAMCYVLLYERVLHSKSVLNQNTEIVDLHFLRFRYS